MSLFAQCDYFREEPAVKKAPAKELHPDIRKIISLVTYDRESGRFTWNMAYPEQFDTEEMFEIYERHYSGQYADESLTANGYREVNFFGFNITAHRLAFAYMEGRLPKAGLEMDHLDGDRQYNAWSNLREVTRQINQRNVKKRCNNTSGHTGVTLHKSTGKYHATLGSKYLGRADTPEAAAELRTAYLAANPELGYTARHGA